MTAPAENRPDAAKPSGGLAQLVRWLNDERPMAGADDVSFVAAAPRRTGRWVHGAPAAAPPGSDDGVDSLAHVRVGPAPRCAVAGEMIALSVALIADNGATFLGWPVRLEWSSSDHSVATVTAGGVVHVHAPGRVQLTCRCEGKTGSVWLTVVEPALAASVGLPVPGRAFPALPLAEVKSGGRAQPPSVAAAAPPRSALALTRSRRRALVRVAGGAATGAMIALVLSQSPEDYFVVGAEPGPTDAAETPTAAARSVTHHALSLGASRAAAGALASVAGPASAPLGDTSKGMLLRESDGRVVSVSAGSTALGSPSKPSTTGTTGSRASTHPSGTTTAVAAVVPAPPQAIARVAVASSPATLAEGESVRLAAATFDDRGEAVAGRTVSWSSENRDIATVDETGIVTAHRAGTVTIVASSEGRVGRVTLTVGARRNPPSTAEVATPAAAPARREAGAPVVTQLIRARIDEFVQALRERDGARVAELYAAESPQDRKNLQVLLERLRRPETRFKTADPQLASPEVREMEAAGEFQLPMSWTTPFGRVRNQTPTFRATLEPGDGGWRLVGIRAVGKLD
jgi:Bacterial Ig-like domain (group 2)